MSKHTQSIVCVGLNAQDWAVLEQVAARSGWSIRRAENRQSSLLRNAGCIIFDGDSDSTDWRRSLSICQALPNQPAFIVISRLADERMWAEVLNRGGYDLVMKPLDGTEIARVIRSAEFRTPAHLAVGA